MVQARHLKRVAKSRPADAMLEPSAREAAPVTAQVVPFEDDGLVGLLMGLKFDPDNDPNLNCPSCGEDIAIDKGLCPKCHELIRAKDPHAFEARVLPVIDARNVVYVHLDVATGDLKFVRKTVGERVELQEVNIEAVPSEPLCDT